MKFGYIYLIIVLLSCTPKNDNIITTEENSFINEMDIKNFDPEIIEYANSTDGFGNELIRLKQKLRSPDEIIDSISNYFASIRNDGSIIINRSIVYPNISNTKIIDYDHISRDYDGLHVDISEFTILLENNQSIKARIFSPYINTHYEDIYFWSNDNYYGTKGLYEFGNIINAYKNNPSEVIANKSEIEITLFSGQDEEGYHQYLRLEPLSKHYYFVIDMYSYFIIDIYSIDNTNEMEIYVKNIINEIKYS
jgi:hypothetical protein